MFTSTNPSVDDPNVSLSSMHDLCLNAKDSAPAIDCNIYASKNFVWFTGGPGPSSLQDGTYMFAVLVPGGQGGNDAPNDCTESNLSDLCLTTGTGAGDTWEHRVFSVSGGVVTYPATGYPGGHDFVNGMIRLMGYDDTTNPGGEYVMAVCNLADRDAEASDGPGVTPSDCKYDNFKVRSSCTENCGGDPIGASVVTEVHLANETVVTPSSVLYLPAFGSLTFHDKATVSTTPNGTTLPAGSTVDFVFYTNGTCAAPPAAGPDSKDISGVTATSVDGGLPRTITAPGAYSYKAFFYSGDLTVVTDAVGDCEPFSVAGQLGKTMGFWGNTNGVAYITSHGNYSGNAVGIGRGSNIDTQGEALKVFPNTLNACGSGNPSIYTVGAATTTNPLKNCLLAAGINIGTFNTNASQLLALRYNIIFVTNYAGQTVGGLGCSANLNATYFPTLTASSTVGDVVTKALALVDNSSTGGSTTQGALGAMNLLLNCLNREL